MKVKSLVSATLAMTLATAGFAYGHDRDDRYSRGRNEQLHRAEHQYRWHDHRRLVERGAGPYHAFYRGDRLPPEYHRRAYVVDNWRAHRLSAPPRGYHWVQAGGDYVLVAIATGIIVQLLLNN